MTSIEKSHLTDDDQKCRVALVQMCSTDDFALNVDSAAGWIEKALKEDPEIQLVAFPENSLFIRVNPEGEKWALDFNDQDSLRPYQKLVELAKSRKLVLHLGANPVWIEKKIFNSHIIIDSSGETHLSYQKIHLFDVQVAGHKPVLESDYYNPGEKAAQVNLCGFKTGLTVCYDLRFGELFVEYAKRGVEVLFIPAAFLVPTGKAHWEVLLRARAIENQCYVIASAQVGTHQSQYSDKKRSSYGHSMVIDPWGKILLELTNEEGVDIVEIDRNEISRVREQIPMINHRNEKIFMSDKCEMIS